uniref:Uncharacterized protein n=1 Tax=Glossina austeni TaxID=7395 RepID=A0A1A9VCR3_GLOAU
MNLWQMPSNSLKYLLCENGQPDTTKITEIVIFDNTNPNQCPLGYEIYREISVCREFSLDERWTVKDRGNSAHQSVWVSIYPNISIRNECITKMLNKNPTELLETKRETATKLIEVNILLHDEIAPKIETLRQTLKSTAASRRTLTAAIDAAKQHIAENRKERKKIRNKYKELEKIIVQTKEEDMKEIKVELKCENRKYICSLHMSPIIRGTMDKRF